MGLSPGNWLAAHRADLTLGKTAIWCIYSPAFFCSRKLTNLIMRKGKKKTARNIVARVSLYFQDLSGHQFSFFKMSLLIKF